MPLTNVAIQNARSGPKPFKMADGGGLFLLVTPAGGKLWRLKYRIAGREKLLSLGKYPTVGLAEARRMRDDAKVSLAHNVDPSELKRSTKTAAANTTKWTFGVVATEYQSKAAKEGRAEATTAKNKWLLDGLSAPLTQRPIALIKAPEILAVLRKVEERGHYETARRLRSSISRVFRYAVATGRAETDPTSALAGALITPQVTHRAAITEPKQVGALLAAIEGYQGMPVVRAALLLMLYCFPRPGEMRQAEWGEFDMDRALWSIPAARTKMRREHRVHLARPVLDILRELYRLTGHGNLVFPGAYTPKRPISENTLNAALRRLGYGSDEMSAHGFRSSASSLLNESGQWNSDAIERALGHQDANAIRRAYARGEYWDERVRMYEWWAGHVQTLKPCRP